MRHRDTVRLLLASAFALAATHASATDNATPPSDATLGAGSCVIVEYQVKSGDPGYTWYYCPSSRVFIRPGQRWITNFDTGIETRVVDQDRKVQTLPLSAKREQQRAEMARRSAPSFTATGKTDVIAGVTADEYLLQLTYDGAPMEIHQWYAKDLPTPGREKSAAAELDKELPSNTPPGVFLRPNDREATSVHKGEPPASVLAIPADYQKQHWSTEKKDWVDGE